LRGLALLVCTQFCFGQGRAAVCLSLDVPKAVDLSLSLSLLQGVAARLGVDWSVAKKWAPLAKDWKSLHACSLIWHGFWNHLSLGNWDG